MTYDFLLICFWHIFSDVSVSFVVDLWEKQAPLKKINKISHSVVCNLWLFYSLFSYYSCDIIWYNNDSLHLCTSVRKRKKKKLGAVREHLCFRRHKSGGEKRKIIRKKKILKSLCGLLDKGKSLLLNKFVLWVDLCSSHIWIIVFS